MVSAHKVSMLFLSFSFSGSIGWSEFFRWGVCLARVWVFSGFIFELVKVEEVRVALYKPNC